MKLDEAKLAEAVALARDWVSSGADVPEDSKCEAHHMARALLALAEERERLRTNAPETTSDGYHTFAELYDHRITLFLAFCSEVDARTPTGHVWRSKLHSDGSKFDGWFIVGVGTEPGKQITYHLPISRWSETDWLRELTTAPKFDGHTSADVLRRLRDFYDEDADGMCLDATAKPDAGRGEG